MHVMVITPYYFPLENPRAYRWTMIVDRMIKLGWQVDVITADDKIFSDAVRHETIHRHGYSTPDKRFTARATPDRRSARFKLLKKVFRLFQWPDESAGWIQSGLRMPMSCIQKSKPDLIITVSWPFSTHVIGLQLKKKFNIPWLVDIGDPFFQGNPIRKERFNFVSSEINQKCQIS